MKTEEKKYEKILFRLERGSDGYPPDDWESLWAFETQKGIYCIDNIPFFIRGISSGDIISVIIKNNELFFKQVEKFSDHSVIRVIVFKETETENLRKKLNDVGCESEKSHLEGLIAVDVPPQVSYQKVISFLQKGEDAGKWEYEEASIRHEDN